VKLYLDNYENCPIINQNQFKGMDKMIKQYEAIYKKGQLQWIGSPPMVIENRRVTVSLADEGDEPKSINVTKLLSETRGILGDRMTMEDIDTDIRTMRDEWTRKWDCA
jgi:hypothetical protein